MSNETGNQDQGYAFYYLTVVCLPLWRPRFSLELPHVHMSEGNILNHFRALEGIATSPHAITVHLLF